jgi:hypothetical protein
VKVLLFKDKMPNLTVSRFEQDSEIWESLKQAISNSSGFQTWQQDQSLDRRISQGDLDIRVRRYLRETLATLAY